MNVIIQPLLTLKSTVWPMRGHLGLNIKIQILHLDMNIIIEPLITLKGTMGHSIGSPNAALINITIQVCNPS